MMQGEAIVRLGLLAVRSEIISEESYCDGFDAPQHLSDLLPRDKRHFPWFATLAWVLLSNGRDLLDRKRCRADLGRPEPRYGIYLVAATQKIYTESEPFEKACRGQVNFVKRNFRF